MSSTSEAAGNGQLDGMLDCASGAEDAAAPTPSCAAGIGTEDDPAVTKPCCIDCGALEAGGGGGGGCCPSDCRAGGGGSGLLPLPCSTAAAERAGEGVTPVGGHMCVAIADDSMASDCTATYARGAKRKAGEPEDFSPPRVPLDLGLGPAAAASAALAALPCESASCAFGDGPLPAMTVTQPTEWSHLGHCHRALAAEHPLRM